MSFEDTKILEFNQDHKLKKTSFIIDPDLQSLIEKIDGCKTNHEKLSTRKLKVKRFHQILQFLQHHLKTRNRSMMYIEVKVP